MKNNNNLGFKINNQEREKIELEKIENDNEQKMLSNLIQKHEYNYLGAVQEQREYIEYIFFSHFPNEDPNLQRKLMDDYRTIIITEYLINQNNY